MQESLRISVVYKPTFLTRLTPPSGKQIGLVLRSQLAAIAWDRKLLSECWLRKFMWNFQKRENILHVNLKHGSKKKMNEWMNE